YKTGEGYHVVPPPYTKTFMPPKPDLVFHDDPTASETVPNVLNVEPSTSKPTKEMSQSNRPTAPIIEDWIQVSHGLGPQKTLSFLFDVQGNPQQNLKDKGVIYSGYSRHMSGNISYLSDFKEINRGYVAFGGNLKGGKITGKDTECVVLSSNFKLPDENHVLLRVLRENNMVLVTKPHNKTPYELLLSRTPSIGFMRPFGCLVTILNTLDPLGMFDEKADEGFLVGYSENKSEVHVSSSSSDKPKKHDEKAKREAKGKITVDLSTRVRDLSDEFEEFPINSTNRVNAASAPVTVVGPNSTNNTNSFNVVGPFDKVTRSMARMVKEQGFMVYQMDAKSAFLYGTIDEDVYVCQPIGFKDPDYLDKVYKLVKVLYGLHQALKAWKKVVITEDTTRQALRLDDTDGIDYLSNKEICAELARMGYEKPSTKLRFYKAFSRPNGNRKFHFSKYIFDRMVRNVDSPLKFLMYPRFLQVMINAQVYDLSSNNTMYTSPALTHKVFANIRRISKGFSGVETHLFDAMLVPQQVHDDVEVEEDEDEDDNEVSAASTPPIPTPATTPPPP
nr:ribonuclease H-like domain-containing protein [Tanacetum cinerariifolium]